MKFAVAVALVGLGAVFGGVVGEFHGMSVGIEDGKRAARNGYALKDAQWKTYTESLERELEVCKGE